jgi:hypothetical protein
MKPRLPQYEEDALEIYRHTRFFLSERMSPSRSEVEATEIYRCGRELDAQWATYSSSRFDTDASSEAWKTEDDSVTRLEEIINNVSDRTGDDKLQFPPGCPPPVRKYVVWYLAHRMLLGCFELAWERQLSELPFPIKVDDDEIRLSIRRPLGQWEEADEGEAKSILGLTNAELRTPTTL